ncbi:MAG: toll/interleukin-1 receptor domain-containing protein [Cyanobacteria bacterium P01_F01_bin.143]
MQVFISHDPKDIKLAQKLAQILRDDSFDVWDDSQILPGENWAKVKGQALEESDAMVVLLTPNSVISPNISFEVGYALGTQKYKGRLIPVIAANSEQLKSTDIPWILKKFQIICLPNLGKDNKGLEQITKVLKSA